VITPRCVSNS